MATPSSAGFTNIPAHPGSPVIASSAASHPFMASQGTQTELDHPATSPMAVGSSSFANDHSHIGRFVGFRFGVNPPVTNSLANPLAHPLQSTMATPSSAGSTNFSHTGSPGIASSAASYPVTSSQGNQSAGNDKALTSPEKNASSLDSANFRSQIRAFSYAAVQKATEKMMPLHTFGSLKTVNVNEPQKKDDDEKPKKEKRKKKKEEPAKPSKHLKGDDS
ncbi:hypothetical protein MRX96_043264 [Rhipicephalus microplus]